MKKLNMTTAQPGLSGSPSINRSRRTFLKHSAATAAASTFGALLPGQKILAGSRWATMDAPPHLPPELEVYQKTFINWAREVVIPDVWFCSPRTAEEMVTLSNWACDNQFKLRPFGTGHGFAPTILGRRTRQRRVILVDTSEYLNQVTVEPGHSIPSVVAGAGATVESICRACEPHGLGLYHTPAPGGVTIAGVLAMNAHGAALPADGEQLQPGHSWGTLSNLVLSLTAVVWEPAVARYELRTYQRNDPAIGPLLTCLARAFIVEVRIQVGPNLKIRCISRADLKIDELLAMPENQNEHSFANLTRRYGTVDVLFYPFNQQQIAWTKFWTVTPEKPTTSREVTGPYNYQPPGSETPPEVADAVAAQLRENPQSVPLYNQQSVDNMAGLIAIEDPAVQINDLWGSAYCTTLYVRPETPRHTVAAWGVIVRRADLQRALGEFYQYFRKLIADFEGRGLYPYTGPVEIRAHGLDQPEDVLVDGAVPPTLSGARPLPDDPDKDTIIWFAINNNVDQPLAGTFNYQLEQWFLRNYRSYGVVRPEWTKCYGYSLLSRDGGAWNSERLLRRTYPDTFRDGYPQGADWDAAVSQLNSLDPNRIFTNDYLDKLFPPSFGRSPRPSA